MKNQVKFKDSVRLEIECNHWEVEKNSASKTHLKPHGVCMCGYPLCSEVSNLIRQIVDSFENPDIYTYAGWCLEGGGSGCEIANLSYRDLVESGILDILPAWATITFPQPKFSYNP